MSCDDDMNRDDLLITQLPTFANVKKMRLTEVREAYKMLEGEAFSQAQHLCDTRAQLNRMIKIVLDYNTTFGALSDSYDAGD